MSALSVTGLKGHSLVPWKRGRTRVSWPSGGIAYLAAAFPYRCGPQVVDPRHESAPHVIMNACLPSRAILESPTQLCFLPPALHSDTQGTTRDPHSSASAGH